MRKLRRKPRPEGFDAWGRPFWSEEEVERLAEGSGMKLDPLPSSNSKPTQRQKELFDGWPSNGHNSTTDSWKQWKAQRCRLGSKILSRCGDVRKHGGNHGPREMWGMCWRSIDQG